jgi:hypothetical protein
LSIAHAFPDEGWIFDLVLPPKVQQAAVWHYTDGGGLRGILHGGSLRATSVLMLNDSVEFRHGAELITSAWEEVSGEYARSGQMSDLLANAAEVLPLQSTYVVCASSDGNSLSQFRAYGSYAIGINPEVPLRARLPDRDHDDTGVEPIYADAAFEDGWRPVVYSTADKRQHVVRLFEALDRLCGEWPADPDGIGRASALAQVWYNQSVAYMKHEAFRDEREVRLTGNLPTNSSGVHLRAGRLGIASYVEVEAIPLLAQSGHAKAPVAEVRIGPGLIDPLAAKAGTRLAFEKLGYGAKVVLLESPLR